MKKLKKNDIIMFLNTAKTAALNVCMCLQHDFIDRHIGKKKKERAASTHHPKKSNRIEKSVENLLKSTSLEETRLSWSLTQQIDIEDVPAAGKKKKFLRSALCAFNAKLSWGFYKSELRSRRANHLFSSLFLRSRWLAFAFSKKKITIIRSTAGGKWWWFFVDIPRR